MNLTPVIKLSANENFYGCSQRVLNYLDENYHKAPLYPEMEQVALKNKVAENFETVSSHVVIGNGSVGIIDALIRTLVDEDEEIITFDYSFIAYGQLAKAHKKKCKFVPLKNWNCDLTLLMNQVDSDTRLIFLANPNNPTGTMLSHAALETFLQLLPQDIYFVLDEAYIEYAVNYADKPDACNLLKKFPNLIVLRSFSKIHGIAGLRIGYGVMQPNIAAKLNQIRVPYSINFLASECALRAMDDKEFISMSARRTADEMQFLYNELTCNGFHTVMSYANFIFVRFESDETKEKFVFELKEGGLIICDLQIFGQAKSVRIGIGDRDVNLKIVKILKRIVG